MTPERRIELSVGLIRRQADRLFVGGRCTHGPLRVGDVFTEAFRYVKAKSLADYGKPPIRCDDSVREIQLEVKSIAFYQRFVNQLYAGDVASSG